jgi:hypothetical protein
MVWGGNCDTPVRAGPSEGHGEQVSEVVWMNPGQSSHAHQPQVLLSAGFDGRLLAWRLETSSGPLSLQHRLVNIHVSMIYIKMYNVLL